MIVTTLDYIPGKTVVTQLGIVNGSSVRAKNAFKDFGSGIKNFFGGELKNYSRLLEETRAEAVERMTAQASGSNANAILNVRFFSSDVINTAAEVSVYGTAVVVQDN